ncbi:MAG: protein TolQ [Hyphomicrobiales bacterium]|nr:protein TolQ [Hyphomicrobiales bacterium]
MPVSAADFSFFSMFWQAHLVVKIVMLGLICASVWGWAIIIDKMFLFARARHQSDAFERQFWSGLSLDQLYSVVSQQPPTHMSEMFLAAMKEWRRSTQNIRRPPLGVLQRIERVMDIAQSREMERLEKRLLFLGTVGSTAPFIGLFGTVWGIMTSFQSIAVSKTTSLAVVAPGIAEALFATALGLLAAIPAVIFYNKFMTEAGLIARRLEAFSDEFLAIVSRQLEMKGVPDGRAA